MNVLVLTVEFPPNVGGAGSYAYNLAAGLSKIGHKVTILTCKNRGNLQDEKTIDNYIKSTYGIKIIRKPFIPKFYIWFLGHCCKRLIEQNSFDILILADAHAQKCAAFTDLTTSQLTWTTFHGTELVNYFEKNTHFFSLMQGRKKLYKLFHKIDGIIAVSEAMKSAIIKVVPEFDNKIHVIHHGIDTEFYVKGDQKHKIQSRHSLKLSQRAKVIFSASRLIKDKGHSFLIRAMPKILKDLPETRLFIAGEGPDRKYFEDLTHKLGLENNIFFTGSLPPQKMVHYFHASDLFVLLSVLKTETFGIVYLEANACGRPVIAHRIPGVVEAVKHNVSGLLIDNVDTALVAKSVLTMLKDDALRRKLAKRGYERVLKNFTKETMAEKTIQTILTPNQ